MPRNNARAWAVVAALITLAGIGMAFAGLTVGDGENFALFFVGLILGLTFLICFFVFNAQARRLDRMFKHEDLLAHWQFDLSQQQKKAREEYLTRKKGHRILLLIVAAFFVLIGGLFVIFGFDDLEDAAGFILIMLAALAVISTAALLAPVMAYRKMRKSSPDVFVGPYGAWVMGEFQMWKTMMTRPRQILFEAGQSGVRLAVHYEIWQRYGWQQHTCRIPVPSGSEQQAYQVANQLAAINQIPFSEGIWQAEEADFDQ